MLSCLLTCSRQYLFTSKIYISLSCNTMQSRRVIDIRYNNHRRLCHRRRRNCSSKQRSLHIPSYVPLKTSNAWLPLYQTAPRAPNNRYGHPMVIASVMLIWILNAARIMITILTVFILIWLIMVCSYCIIATMTVPRMLLVWNALLCSVSVFFSLALLCFVKG